MILRVLMGGSVNIYSGYLRTPLRSRDLPESRLRVGGFRLTIRRQA